MKETEMRGEDFPCVFVTGGGRQRVGGVRRKTLAPSPLFMFNEKKGRKMIRDVTYYRDL